MGLEPVLTLYRTSPFDASLRVNWATFDMTDAWSSTPRSASKGPIADLHDRELDDLLTKAWTAANELQKSVSVDLDRHRPEA